MLFFLQAVFISIVILYRGNIWAAVVPQPSALLITFGGIVLLISFMKRGGTIVKYQKSSILLSVLGLIIIIGTQFAIGRNIASMLAYINITIISVLMISCWKKKEEIIVMRIFLIICSAIALAGLIAWLIVAVQFFLSSDINPDHIISLCEFTDGRMIRDDGRGWKNQFNLGHENYSFPYYLGLVLTGSYAYEFFGISFFRASGIFHEPVFTSFLIIPAILLTLNPSYFSKRTRNILLTIQIFFAISSFSLSIIISLIAAYFGFYGARLIKNIPRINPKKVLQLVLMVGLVFLIGAAAFFMTPATGIARNIIYDKLVNNNFYVDGILSVLLDPYYFLSYYFILVVNIFCLFLAAKKNDVFLRSYSLTTICFLIISLKGYFIHVLIHPGTFIFFFLTLKNLGRSGIFSKNRPRVTILKPR